MTSEGSDIRFPDVNPESSGFRDKAAPPRQGISVDMFLGVLAGRPPIVRDVHVFCRVFRGPMGGFQPLATGMNSSSRASRLRRTTSLRITATRASFAGFPRALSPA